MPELDLSAIAGSTIAFDLDGTLVDTAPDLIGTLNVLLAQEGVAALPLDEARPFIGRGAKWMIQRGFEAAGAPLDPAQLPALFDRFLDYYLAHIADQSRPFPGVEDALERLRGAGARLAVCTNKLTDLSVRLLDAVQLSPFFDAVVGADAAQAQKPDPRHLVAAVQAAGGSMDKAILVGDAATDAGAARAANAGLILVTFGYTETPAAELSPDVLIDRFDQLPGACASLLGACAG